MLNTELRTLTPWHFTADCSKHLHKLRQGNIYKLQMLHCAIEYYKTIANSIQNYDCNFHKFNPDGVKYCWLYCQNLP